MISFPVDMLAQLDRATTMGPPVSHAVYEEGSILKLKRPHTGLFCHLRKVICATKEH